MAINRSAATHEGSAYDFPGPSYDAESAKVGRCTSCGEGPALGGNRFARNPKLAEATDERRAA
jgi:hypothetical protein